MKATSCDFCANYAYDEESESYFCDVNLDEDEYYRFISTEYKECPYYRSGDEYKVVRHQMQRGIGAKMITVEQDNYSLKEN